MNMTVYPLGHEETEIQRLDTQAALLRDPLLERLATGATQCLEIGCGTGSNLSLLRSVNPELKYTGIDNAEAAITVAKTRTTAAQAPTAFHVMDATRLAFEEAAFDLVFTKLVLWSIGPGWPEVLRQAYRVLKPGGVMYAFEPCNQLVQLHPEKPAAQKWMRMWDEAAIQKGLDPYLGPKVASELYKAGFAQVRTKFHPVLAMGSQQQAYKAIIGNLKGFYLGPGAVKLGLNPSEELGMQAACELDTWQPENLVIDALFVAWGTKPYMAP